MIINVSRWKSFKLCKRKTFNTYHRMLEGERSMNLVDGGAFHKGVAVGRATHDWKEAQKAASELFTEDVAKSNIPPEQEYLIAEHKQLVQKMLQCFEEQYEHETYQIIQPECEFDVELPQSQHNCVMLHWRDSDNQEHEGPPSAEDIISGNVWPAHSTLDQSCFCFQPHRFTGRTDAIVQWNHNIWLDEYKTTSIGGEQFWDQWHLDIQPTAYLYGIWRQLGVRPRGFLLNAINKPSEAQVANWNSKRRSGELKTAADYIRLDREGFFRSEEDLWRVERQIVQVCYEWEREITDHHMPDRFGMTPMSHTCKNYNRKCDFFGACQAHDEGLDSLAKREADYVDLKYLEVKK